MKLTFFRGKHPNFGDELNTLIWPHILPAGFLDEREDELFLGAGSILWNTFPRNVRKIVAGSGYGGYSAPPDVSDGSWEFIFIRGPRTAKALGLRSSLPMADAAILLREIPLPPSKTGIGIAFMPHFQSAARGDWEEVCRLAGITFLDPRAEVETILSCILGADLLITEAMHGAIVADALRIPWIAAEPLFEEHRSKWYDWAEALRLDLRFHGISASNWAEWRLATHQKKKLPVVERLIARSPVAQVLGKRHREEAAENLRRLALREPQLSKDVHIASATDAAMSGLEKFVSHRMEKRQIDASQSFAEN